jgi:fructoselysine-6-P-deglycase FrlB-like protein
MTATDIQSTTLWRETKGIPHDLADTLDSSEADLARFYADSSTRRIVATGNGAAYYVALSLQAAAWLRPHDTLDVAAIPAGMLASQHFQWRQGDRLLAISSSGEMGDVITALERGAPANFGAITANPSSTIGRAASALATVSVASQDSATHTAAYVGNTASALALWAQLTGDDELIAKLIDLPKSLGSAIDHAPDWAAEAAVDLGPLDTATVFGSGPAWPAALETALLLKEVAALPAEGMETGEGGTSGMYALSDRSLALPVSGAAGDSHAEAAAQNCRTRGAHVIAIRGNHPDLRVAAVSSFPAAVALAAQLGLRRGVDLDHPPWLDAYYAAARSKTSEAESASPGQPPKSGDRS